MLMHHIKLRHAYRQNIIYQQPSPTFANGRTLPHPVQDSKLFLLAGQRPFDILHKSS